MAGQAQGSAALHRRTPQVTLTQENQGVALDGRLAVEAWRRGTG